MNALDNELQFFFFFFFNDTATTEIYPLSYTTLFRSAAARRGAPGPWEGRRPPGRRRAGREVVQPFRSEEHTSELQSQSNLVCRLLLEKKKTTQCTTL